jgi:N-glycosylase/DNA lyase
MTELDRLKQDYVKIRPAIESRLREFEEAWESGTDETIFRELVFCLFTPQSRAKSCWAAVERIRECNLVTEGSAKQISRELRGVRFHHTKAKRVAEARKHLDGLKARIAGFENPQEARRWLVENVDGMGYKEASHFLRNIGMGRDLAILDRHILKNLVALGVIPEMPDSISEKRYLRFEDLAREFCLKEGIPMDHLDLLLWCRETGEIFK